MYFRCELGIRGDEQPQRERVAAAEEVPIEAEEIDLVEHVALGSKHATLDDLKLALGGPMRQRLMNTLPGKRQR